MYQMCNGLLFKIKLMTIISIFFQIIPTESVAFILKFSDHVITVLPLKLIFGVPRSSQNKRGVISIDLPNADKVLCSVH